MLLWFTIYGLFACMQIKLGPFAEQKVFYTLKHSNVLHNFFFLVKEHLEEAWIFANLLFCFILFFGKNHSFISLQSTNSSSN